MRVEWEDVREKWFIEPLKLARARRLEKEFAIRTRGRLRCLMTLFSAHRTAHWLPGAGAQAFGGFGDYAHIFQCIIGDEPADTPLETVALELEDLLPEEIQRLSEDIKGEYLKVAGAALKDTPAAEVENPLSLAIVSFTCINAC